VNKTPAVLILGLGIVGLVCGFAGKRLITQSNPAAPPPVASQARSASTRTAANPPASAASKLPKPAKILSTDTLESLATADADSLYGRLAAWLMEASEPDVAAYWASVKDKPRTNDITDLVFIHWTRLDPQAAIAAVAGTGSEHYAWWAWACHDPKGALAAAIAANPDRVNNVAWGIGEFHPAWLLEHFDEIPESGRGNAISGLTKWDDTDRPLEMLEFLKKHNSSFRPRIFEALVRKDPWAAYDWMQANPRSGNGFDADPFAPGYGDMMAIFIKATSDSQPDILERLAAKTPSGELKRQMEAAVFNNLLKTDPTAALEQANATKAPLIASQRLAAVGLSQLETDPEQAFEIAKKLFATNPAALKIRSVVQGPSGMRSMTTSTNSAVTAFVDALMAKDPAQVMALQPPPKGNPQYWDSDYMELGQRWAQQDLEGYTDWVKQQTDPAIRDAAVLPVVNSLIQSDQYVDAAEWARTSTAAKGQLTNLLYQWNRNAPDEARQWLESADLPAEEKTRLNQFMKHNP
jgi:hypothetical protein